MKQNYVIGGVIHLMLINIIQDKEETTYIK